MCLFSVYYTELYAYVFCFLYSTVHVNACHLIYEGGEECPIYSVAEPHASNGLSVPLIGGVAGGLVLLICGTLLLILIVVGMKRRHSKREQSSGRCV